MLSGSFTEPKHAGEFIYSEADGFRSRDNVQFATDVSSNPGDILGVISCGTVSAVAYGSNAGAETITVSAAAGNYDYAPEVLLAGSYKAELDSATRYTLYGPDGEAIAAELVVGTTYVIRGLSVLVTTGSGIAAGDYFTITVLPGTYEGATIAANEGNTGNPTFSAVTLESGFALPIGEYQVVCQSPTAAYIYDPNGVKVGGTLTFGSAYSTNFGLTITAGTVACVDNDAFTITVTGNTAAGQYGVWSPTATNGLQWASAVNIEVVTGNTSGPVISPIIAREAKLNGGALNYGTATLGQINAANSQLKARGISVSGGV